MTDIFYISPSTRLSWALAESSSLNVQEKNFVTIKYRRATVSFPGCVPGIE